MGGEMEIVNGLIHTMGKQGIIKHGAVRVENGKIAWVGTMKQWREKYHAADCEEPILDAAGGWVLPGIIEAHCHMGITEEKKGMEGDDCNETVDPVTPWLRAIDAINSMDAAFDDAVRAGITAAMIGPGSSNVVGGQFALVKTRGRRIDDIVVKAPAAMKVAFGENPKVNYSGQGKSPSTRMAIAGMLRRELFEAKRYWEQKVLARGRDEAFQEDFTKECWIPVLRREIPLKAHVHRVDDIFTAIRIAREFGLDMTLDHCSEGHLIAQELAAVGFPAIVGPDLTRR
ncbi:MAG: amidohydrolase, partial [Acetatifactor sp.]|nr:amidohydrolase [Acetatifactor sp.]